MNIEEYKDASSRTFANHKTGIDARTTDLLHCVIGVTTESGELMDQFKRHIYYGKPLDVVNIKEELGDKMWYIMNLCRLLDLSLEEIMDININKLKVRFPDKFSNEAALNRNLEAEREKLENNDAK